MYVCTMLHSRSNQGKPLITARNLSFETRTGPPQKELAAVGKIENGHKDQASIQVIGKDWGIRDKALEALS